MSRAKNALHVVLVVAAGHAASLPAQDWSLRAGASAQAEYTDNYLFLTSPEVSATTVSILPWVAATRRTPTGSVGMYAIAGANRVFGAAGDDNYFTGRAQVEGTIEREQSQLQASIGVYQDRSVESVVLPGEGVVYSLTESRGAFANLAYAHTLSERWAVDARLAGSVNRYDNVGNDAAGDALLSDSDSWSAGAGARYKVSDETAATFTAYYSRLSSDTQKSDSGTIVAGVVHRYSPALTLSGSAGYHWTDTTNAGSAKERESGPLFGGQVDWQLSERARILAGATQKLAPSGIGVLSRQTSAYAGMSYRISEPVTARASARYTRDRFLSGVGDTVNDSYYALEAGLLYRISERWSLDASYRYSAARYPEDQSEPRANTVLLNLSYNWPSATYVPGTGVRLERQGLPGAGPVEPTLPAGQRVDPAAPVPQDQNFFDALISR